MNSEARKNATRRFAVRQAILLLITIVLVAFFTIPMLKAVKAAANPGQLEAIVNQAKQEVAGLETKVMVVQSRITMGAGHDEAQEKIKQEVKELKQQMALKELENKHLQDQMLLVQTMLQVMNAKSTPPPQPGMDFWHKLAELATKVFGCIGSLFTGGMFLLGWWRKKGQPPQEAPQGQ